jgi:response regulator RpfG family c-di-GMP phosphodiesterase
VNDSAARRKNIVNTLKRIGYDDIAKIEEGADIYARLESESGINFMVINWDMLNMNGLEIVNKVRKGNLKPHRF